MPDNYVSLYCGKLVEGVRTSRVKTHGLFHPLVFCTNFVRSLWTVPGSFALFSRSLKPQLSAGFVSVNSQLYSLSTALTNTTSSKSNT